jgi:hypothetical protein
MRDELLELTGISAMRLSELETSLSEEWSSGIISFSKDSLRQAVDISHSDERSLHLKIAKFLVSHDDSIDSKGRAIFHWESVFGSQYDRSDGSEINADVEVEEAHDFDLYKQHKKLFSEAIDSFIKRLP